MSFVTVLLCTCNSSSYLSIQLDSILQQSCSVSIIVSDDNSTDGTRETLADYAASHAQLTWRSGPAQGFARNFFSLINDSNITGEYFALADQDDRWLPQHLSRAQHALAQIPSNVPALYASRTELVDMYEHFLGRSPHHDRPPHFLNALVQNIASGNSMIFNRATRDLLVKLSACAMPPWHDWALYQVVTACGGQVFYSQEPSVLYRQHGNNAIGAQWTLASRWHRVRKLLRARFRDWNTQNLQALQGIAEHITPENRALMARFAEVRQRRTPWGRVIGLYRLGLYRQTRLGQLGLYVAAFFKLM